MALVLVVGVVVMSFVGFDCVFYVVAFEAGCGCNGFRDFFFFLRWWWWWLVVGCEFLFDIFFNCWWWWSWLVVMGGRQRRDM